MNAVTQFNTEAVRLHLLSAAGLSHDEAKFVCLRDGDGIVAAHASHMLKHVIEATLLGLEAQALPVLSNAEALFKLALQRDQHFVFGKFSVYEGLALSQWLARGTELRSNYTLAAQQFLDDYAEHKRMPGVALDVAMPLLLMAGKPKDAAALYASHSAKPWSEQHAKNGSPRDVAMLLCAEALRQLPPFAGRDAGRKLLRKQACEWSCKKGLLLDLVRWILLVHWDGGTPKPAHTFELAREYLGIRTRA